MDNTGAGHSFVAGILSQLAADLSLLQELPYRYRLPTMLLSSQCIMMFLSFEWNLFGYKMFYLYLLHNSFRYVCHLMNYWPTIWVYPWPSNKCQCCYHWYKVWINVLDMARTIRLNQRVWNGKKLDNLLNINSFRHWYVVNISIMTYLLPTRKWRLDTYYFLK